MKRQVWDLRVWTRILYGGCEMGFLQWYLNLSFFDAVLVWLKLLLPVLFLLTVAGLVGLSFRWYAGGLRVPKPTLPDLPVRSNRQKKPAEKTPA